MKRLVSVTTAISLVATGTVMITQIPAHAVTGPAWTTPVVVGEPQGDENGVLSGHISGDGQKVTFEVNHNSPSWTQVRLRERTGPSTFGAATTLSPTTDYASNSMINRGGNAVVWDNNNTAIRGNKIVGGSWADPDTGTTGFGTQTNSSDAQTSNDGSRTLWSWHNDDSSQYNVYASTWNADGTAGAPETVNPGLAGAVYRPKLSGDGNHAIFEQGSGPYPIYVSTRSGSSWTPEKAVDNADYPIGVSKDGSALTYDVDSKLYGAHKVDGVWKTTLLGSVTSYDYEPYVSQAQDGSIAWLDENDVGWVSQYRDGNWQTPARIIPEGDGYVYSVSLSDNGNVLTYLDYNSEYKIRSKSFINGAWSDEYVIDDNAGYGDIMVSGNGCAVVYKRNSNAKIYYSHTVTPCTPTPVSAAQAGSDASANVTWGEPPEGASATTSYTAQAYDGSTLLPGKTCTVAAPATSCKVSGLTVGSTYRFKVLATNSSGDSPQSEYTNDVTLTGGNPTPPNVVRKLKVTGGSFAKKYVVSWKVPKDASGQPVLYYRLKLKQIGFAKLLKNVRLKSSVEKYTFTRKWLLKHSKRSRGDVRGIQLNYRVTVEAFNTAGGGPLAASRFHLKIA